MLVDDRVILELKAVEALAPVHTAQMLTYLRLSGCKVGLLINFNVPVGEGRHQAHRESRWTLRSSVSYLRAFVAPFLRCDPVPSVIFVISNRCLCYPRQTEALSLGETEERRRLAVR